MWHVTKHHLHHDIESQLPGETEQHLDGEVVSRRVAQWGAEVNLREQENLLNLICAHQADSGNTLKVVAERLGLTEDETRDVLSGEVDMTLSELRQVAIACDAVISYAVEPVRTAYRDWFSSLVAARALRDTGPHWEEHRSVEADARRYLTAYVK